MSKGKNKKPIINNAITNLSNGNQSILNNATNNIIHHRNITMENDTIILLPSRQTISVKEHVNLQEENTHMRSQILQLISNERILIEIKTSNTKTIEELRKENKELKEEIRLLNVQPRAEVLARWKNAMHFVHPGSIQ